MADEILTPRRRFAKIVARGEGRLDLAEAALVVAQEEYPLLDPRPYLERLDDWARRARARLPHRNNPAAAIQALNRLLFSEEGFHGNREDYYDPRNSFLNEVMDRKTGIPLTLSLVYMEVARRAGLPVAGVGLPGHFIVGYLAPSRVHWIDPFDKGRALTEQDCRETVERIYGNRVPFRREAMRPVGGLAILKRLLTNLKTIYVQSESPAKALSVIEMLALLDPSDWTEVRDRGLVRYKLRHYPAALADVETYLKNAPDSEDRAELLRLAGIIGKKLGGKPDAGGRPREEGTT